MFYLFHQCSHKKPFKSVSIDVVLLFMTIFEDFGKNLQKTPLKKCPFFWFVFFGQTKKMNKTHSEKEMGLNACSTKSKSLSHLDDIFFYLKTE